MLIEANFCWPGPARWRPSTSNVGRLSALEGVEFRGALLPDEVTELLDDARVLVVPTRWNEGGSIISAKGSKGGSGRCYGPA